MICCTNKGCFETQTPFIDQETKEVYCSVCDQTIANVSDFTKRQMIAQKQFRPKKKETFAVKCEACKKEGKPQIINEEVCCGQCSKPLSNITSVYKNMLKTQLKGNEK